jgi:hypothetical protein
VTRGEAAAKHAACKGLAWHVTENPYRVGDLVRYRGTRARVVATDGRTGLVLDGPFPGTRTRHANISDTVLDIGA